MSDIKAYFISITASAILCAVITGLFDKKESTYKIVKMICGIFLTFALIRPLIDIELKAFPGIIDAVSENAQASVSYGEAYRNRTLSAIIKEETEAYILDKAQALSCTLDVEVVVDDSGQPIPTKVYITGSLPNAAKSSLQQIIETDLFIAKENQIWIQ